MGFPILVRWHLYIDSAPCYPRHVSGKVHRMIFYGQYYGAWWLPYRVRFRFSGIFSDGIYSFVLDIPLKMSPNGKISDGGYHAAFDPKAVTDRGHHPLQCTKQIPPVLIGPLKHFLNTASNTSVSNITSDLCLLINVPQTTGNYLNISLKQQVFQQGNVITFWLRVCLCWIATGIQLFGLI